MKEVPVRKEGMSMAFNFGGYGMSGLFGRNSYGSSFYSSFGNYASIRSGTYKKLLNSYYSKVKQGQPSASDEDKKTNAWNNRYSYTNPALTSARKEADELTASANALTAQGSKSLFTEKYTTTTDAETGVQTTTKGYDRDAIEKAVNSFVTDYNSAVKAGRNSANSNVQRNTAYMTQQTGIYARSLSEVGISIEKDNTLSVDSDKLKSANIDTLKRVFNGPTSFASQTASRSGSISQSAARASSPASTYNRTGNYNNFYNNYYSAYNWYF